MACQKTIILAIIVIILACITTFTAHLFELGRMTVSFRIALKSEKSKERCDIITYLQTLSQSFLKSKKCESDQSKSCFKTCEEGTKNRQEAKSRELQHVRDERGNVKQQHAPNGKCMEMFTISEPFGTDIRSHPASNVIDTIKRNREHDIGGDTAPYEKLSHLLPTLITKYESDVKNISSSYFDLFAWKTNLNGYNPDRFMLNKTINNLLNALDNMSGLRDFSMEEVVAVRSYMLSHQGKSYTHKLKPGNRLQGTGSLPYIPCRMVENINTDQLLKCFNRTIQQSPDSTYHLAFMGDSKIRQLFTKFVVETRALNYTIQIGGSRLTVEEWLLSLRHGENDFFKEASAQNIPGFKISASFETFDVFHSLDFSEKTYLMKLKRWATGEEKAPDLLIIGYGQWMLLQINLQKDISIAVDDALDFSWSMHGAVLRLLLNMNTSTLVLVLAQTRSRPRVSNRGGALAYNTFNNANTEYSEHLFQARLRRMRRKLLMKKYKPFHIKNIFKTSYYSDDYSELNRRLRLSSMDREAEKEAKAAKHKDSWSPIHITERTPSNSGIPNQFKWNHVPFTHKTKEKVNIWLWDSTLPLNLASRRDCYSMYQHDPVTAKLSTVASKFRQSDTKLFQNWITLGVDVRALMGLSPDPRGGKFDYFLGAYDTNMAVYREIIRDKIKVLNVITAKNPTNRTNQDIMNLSIGKIFNAKEFRREKEAGMEMTGFKQFEKLEKKTSAGHSSGLQQLLDSNGLKVAGLKKHNTTKSQRKQIGSQPENVSNDLTKEEDLKKMEEYYNKFVSAYFLPDLNCPDYNHAGVTTTQVEVIQLLNLICNRHMDLPDDYCCTT